MRSELSISIPYLYRGPSGPAFIIDEPFDYSDGDLETVSSGFWDMISGTMNVVSSKLDNTVGGAPRTQPTDLDTYTIAQNQSYYGKINFLATNVAFGTNGFTLGFRNRPPLGEFVTGFQILNNGGTYIINALKPDGDSFVTNMPANGAAKSVEFQAVLNGSNFDYVCRTSDGASHSDTFAGDPTLDRYSPFLTATVGTATTPRGVDRIRFSTPTDAALTS